MTVVPDRRRDRVRRWLYRDGHPNHLARLMNRLDARQFGSGRLSPRQAVALEVRGRRSGRPITLPVVVADVEARRYLVAMLGEQANWVRNVRAAHGAAVLRRGGREPVHLVEVPVDERAPVLRRYLALAPGARAHFPVDRDAPLDEFVRIADRYPVFRIEPDPAGDRGGFPDA